MERSSGCNSMVCKVCSYEWCWKCGVSNYKAVHLCLPENDLHIIKPKRSLCKSICLWTTLVLISIIFLPVILLLVPFIIPCIISFNDESMTKPDYSVTRVLTLFLYFVFSIPLFIFYFVPKLMFDRVKNRKQN